MVLKDFNLINKIDFKIGAQNSLNDGNFKQKDLIRK